jgi:hypothetical protein
MSTLGKILGNVLWYTSWFGFRQPKKVVQAVLVNGPHNLGLSAARLINSATNAALDRRRNELTA